MTHEPRYRTGRTLGRTLYDTGELIGMVDTVEQAETIVAALNRSGVPQAPRPCSGMDADPICAVFPGPVEFTLLQAIGCGGCGAWATRWVLDPAAGVLRHGDAA